MAPKISKAPKNDIASEQIESSIKNRLKDRDLAASPKGQYDSTVTTTADSTRQALYQYALSRISPEAQKIVDSAGREVELSLINQEVEASTSGDTDKIALNKDAINTAISDLEKGPIKDFRKALSFTRSRILNMVLGAGIALGSQYGVQKGMEYLQDDKVAGYVTYEKKQSTASSQPNTPQYTYSTTNAKGVDDLTCTQKEIAGQRGEKTMEVTCEVKKSNGTVDICKGSGEPLSKSLTSKIKRVTIPCKYEKKSF